MTLQPSRRPLKELGAAGMKILKVDDDVESFFFFSFFFCDFYRKGDIRDDISSNAHQCVRSMILERG